MNNVFVTTRVCIQHVAVCVFMGVCVSSVLSIILSPSGKLKTKSISCFLDEMESDDEVLRRVRKEKPKPELLFLLKFLFVFWDLDSRLCTKSMAEWLKL